MRPAAHFTVLLLCALVVPVRVGAEDISSLYEQGLTAFESRSYASAELIFGTIVDSKNDIYRDRAWFYLALSIYHQGRHSAALFELNRFLLVCQSQTLAARAQFWVAECLRQMKRSIAAIEEYKRFIARNPRDPLTVTAHERIGDIYNQDGRYDEAIIEWGKAAALSPDRRRTLRLTVKIGEAHFMNADYAASLGVLDPILDSIDDITLGARARLAAGRARQRTKDHRGALRALSRIDRDLTRDSPYVDALYFMAISQYAEGDVKRARSLLEEFIGAGLRSEYYFDALYELGRIHIEHGNEVEGMQLLEQVRNATSKPDLKARAALILSRIYLRKDPERAIPYLEDVASIDDPAEQKNALMLLGRAYLAARRFDDAERTVEQVNARFPHGPEADEARFLLAGIAVEKGDVARGMKGFEAIALENPFSRFIHESLYYRALAEHRRGNPSQARAHLSRYLSIKKPERGYEATALLVEVALARRSITEAENAVGSLLANYSDHAGIDGVLCRLGRSLDGAGRDGDRYFRIAMERYPSSRCACDQFRSRGDRALDRAEYQRAEEPYRRYLRSCPAQPSGEVFVRYVRVQYHLGRYRHIVSSAGGDTYLTLDDAAKSAVSLFIARSSYRLGDYSRAHQHFIIGGRDTLPDDDRFEASMTCAAVGDFEALGLHLSVLERNKPLHRRALKGLGDYFRRTGNYEMAKTYYLWYLLEEPSPESADDVRMILAELGVQQGDYNSAIVHLNDITSAALRDRQSAMLIVAYFRSGNDDTAVALSERHAAELRASRFGEMAFRENVAHYYRSGDAENFSVYAERLRRYPGNEDFLDYNDARLSFRLNDYERSRRLFESLGARSVSYRAEADFYCGMIAQYVKNDIRAAMKYFNRLTGNAASPRILANRVRVHLAVLSYEQGRPDSARRYLDEILASSPDEESVTRVQNLYEYFGFSK